jgi:hypothetical protein
MVNSDVVVQPVALAGDRLPGTRVLEAFSQPLTLGEQGEIPPDLDTATIRSSPKFLEAASGAPEASTLTVPGKAVLETPVSVAAIPATAILVAEDQTACVFSGSDVLLVHVVGSEFGNSFVTFPDGRQPDSVLTMVPESQRTCD